MALGEKRTGCNAACFDIEIGHHLLGTQKAIIAAVDDEEGGGGGQEATQRSVKVGGIVVLFQRLRSIGAIVCFPVASHWRLMLPYEGLCGLIPEIKRPTPGPPAIAQADGQLGKSFPGVLSL